LILSETCPHFVGRVVLGCEIIAYSQIWRHPMSISSFFQKAAICLAAGYVTLAQAAPAPTTTILSSSLNPSMLGQSVTFFAAVNGTNITGTVDFGEGATILCSGVVLAGTGSAKLASCTTSSLTVGLHTISAAYRGDANNSPSSATLVQEVDGPTPTATTTALSSSPNPSSLGQNVTLAASVSGSNPSGTVSFYDGAALIAGCNAVSLAGTGGNKTAICVVSALLTGSHTISATYSGDSTNATSSGSVVQVVNSVNVGVFAAPALSASALLVLIAALAGFGLKVSRLVRQ